MRGLLVSALTAAGILIAEPAAHASPSATTEQELRSMVARVDPGGIATWRLADLGANYGEADMAAAIAYISPAVPDALLFEVVTHELAHIRQANAFGGGQPGAYNAFVAFDELVDHGRSTRLPHRGLEYGADCMTDLAGGKPGSYGCLSQVRTFATQIANGADFSRVQGRLDSATVSGQSVTVSGWSFDPVSPTRSNTVTITVNGKSTTLTANGTQAAVNATYGTVGTHGYSGTVSGLATGTHQVCATGRVIPGNVYPSKEVSLGCRSITVAGPQAKFKVDAATVSGTTLTVRGWSYDPRNTKSSNPIQLFVDGKHIASTTANLPRADVNKAFGITGNHGYTLSRTLTPGKHTICARGGAVAGSGSTWSGQSCTTVTVR